MQRDVFVPPCNCTERVHESKRHNIDINRTPFTINALLMDIIQSLYEFQCSAFRLSSSVSIEANKLEGGKSSLQCLPIDAHGDNAKKIDKVCTQMAVEKFPHRDWLDDSDNGFIARLDSQLQLLFLALLLYVHEDPVVLWMSNRTTTVHHQQNEFYFSLPPLIRICIFS